jgi:hypothetical protein
MKFSSLVVAAGFLVIAFSHLSSISADEQQYQGCKIMTNNKGVITSMLYTNLKTDLNIEKEFLFTLNADGTPANCAITFNNGVQRDMKPGEMALHFAECGGPGTVTDYYKEHGKR